MNELETLFESYKKIPLDNKRNEISNELISISVLLDSVLSSYGIDSENIPFDYKSDEHILLEEEELLEKFYQDIVFIKIKIVKLSKIINKN